MRSRFIFAALLLNGATTCSVQAAPCAEICYTKELTGFAPGGVPGCTCSGSQQGARTGTGGCNCGQCYEETQGVVFGFAINADGTCTYGQDCGSCDYSVGSSASASDEASSSRSATTPSPVLGSSSASNSTSTGAESSSTSLSTVDSSSAASSNSGESTSTDSTRDDGSSHAGSEALDKKLSTWQIALAICCTVLLFIVAVVSVFACYCKARSRLYQHEEDLASYYNQHQQRAHQAFVFQPWTPNQTAPPVPVHAPPQAATKSASLNIV